LTELESIEYLDYFLKRLLSLKNENYKASLAYFLNFQTAGDLSLVEAEMILEKLVRDGYVVKIDKHKNNPNISAVEHLLRYNYCLTFDGKVFIENEGYSKRFLYEKEKKELELAQIQSVIDTNKSVRNVNRLFWLTVIIAIASAAASIKSCQTTNQQNKLSPELQSKDSIIQSLKNKLSQKERFSILSPPPVAVGRLTNGLQNYSVTNTIKHSLVRRPTITL